MKFTHTCSNAREQRKEKGNVKKDPHTPLCREVCRSCVSIYVLFDFLYYSIFWGLRQAD